MAIRRECDRCGQDISLNDLTELRLKGPKDDNTGLDLCRACYDSFTAWHEGRSPLALAQADKTPLAAAGIPQRYIAPLERERVYTVGDLLGLSRGQVERLRNVGTKGAAEAHAVMNAWIARHENQEHGEVA